MMKEYVNRFVKWSGWKKVFPFPVWAEVLLFVSCGAGLIWVFVHGLEAWWPSYLLYALSAYSLTALCVHIPASVRMVGSWRQRHPKLDAALKNEELHFKLELYRQQIVNFGYGIYKIVSGIIIGSAWIGADGIYNFVQALIQLFQILRRKKPGTIERQWRSYRFCGVLILLMHLTLIGVGDPDRYRRYGAGRTGLSALPPDIEKRAGENRAGDSSSGR